MTTKDDLRSFSDKAHARIDTLTSQYRAAIKEGNHAMAAVLQGGAIVGYLIRSGNRGLQGASAMTDQEYTLALLLSFTFSATCMWLMLKDIK